MKNVKKYIAIVLAVLMFSALFAACNRDDDSSNASENEIPAAFEGRKMEPYIDLILSKNYTYETTPKNETPITFVQYGDDQKMLSLNVEVDGTETAITYMLKDDSYYLLTAADKNYTELSASQVKKLKVDNLFNNASLEKFPNASYVGEGTATISGVEYAYEDYYNPLVQVKNRYFFNEDDQLVYMARINDNGKVGTKIPVTILETNPTVFDVLSDYEYIEQVTTKKTTTTTAKA